MVGFNIFSECSFPVLASVFTQLLSWKVVRAGGMRLSHRVRSIDGGKIKWMQKHIISSSIVTEALKLHSPISV